MISAFYRDTTIHTQIARMAVVSVPHDPFVRG